MPCGSSFVRGRERPPGSPRGSPFRPAARCGAPNQAAIPGTVRLHRFSGRPGIQGRRQTTRRRVRGVKMVTRIHSGESLKSPPLAWVCGAAWDPGNETPGRSRTPAPPFSLVAPSRLPGRLGLKDEIRINLMAVKKSQLMICLKMDGWIRRKVEMWSAACSRWRIQRFSEKST